MNHSEQKRVTIRLNRDQIAGIEQVCRETGRDMSMVVRNALHDFFNRRQNESHRSDRSASSIVQRQIAANAPSQATGDRGGLTGVQVASTAGSKMITPASTQPCPTVAVKAAGSQSVGAGPELSVPPSIAALLTQSRGLGAELPKIRRQQFQLVVAATFIAMESGENARDAQLYAELIRIGLVFSLLA